MDRGAVNHVGSTALNPAWFMGTINPLWFMGGSYLIIFYRFAPIESMHYVYVLPSQKDKKFYIGFTGDLQRRLKEHNTGKNISTKSKRSLKLIYYEAHSSKKDAMRRKRSFKTTKGKSTLKQMLRDSLKAF